MHAGVTIESGQRVTAAETQPGDSTVAPPHGPARSWSLVVLGKPSETNKALVAAFADLGCGARLVCGSAPPLLGRSDVAIGRIDVLPTLDGIEPSVWDLARVERQGALVLNGTRALHAAHDKLETALFLGRAGVAQPQTAHVRDVSVPSFPPPYVVKPRFGSWGQEVHLCRDADELRARLERVRHQRWFRRHGALVQSLVAPTGRDLRAVVAAGRVLGAIERLAPPGEWRTNVSLGARRRQVDLPLTAQALAVRAVAAVGLDLAGVDIAFDHAGNLYVLEVNGAVDFTEAYGDHIFSAAAAALVERAAALLRARSRQDDAAGIRPMRAVAESGS